MRAARTDANQREIVKALRKIGASVYVTSAVGAGFPDLVVGYCGRNWLIECKDGEKRPSERKLTPDQIEFKATWRGHWAVALDPLDAISIVNQGQQ
jgi:Holliday junction resolvase